MKMVGFVLVKHQAQITPFTHAEVENIAAQCGVGEFVGGCTKCKDCNATLHCSLTTTYDGTTSTCINRGNCTERVRRRP